MEQYKFNHDKLRGKIVEKKRTLINMADSMGISDTVLGNRLSNKSHFSQDEIYFLVKELEIEPEEISLYFFTLEVGKTQVEKKGEV